MAKWTSPGLLAASLALTLLLTGGSPPVVPDPVSPQAAPAMAVQTASTARKLVPVGRAVGIKLFSDGVLVVGLSQLDTAEGAVSPGKASGLRTGDVITHVNGQEVDTVEQVQTILREDGAQPLQLRTSRKGKVMQLSATAAVSPQGTYQLGVWLRDSMAGIGTLTYYDPATGSFAALGHGVNDVDTGQLMPLETGAIMPATVAGVRRGEAGSPGELQGTFDLKRDLGSLQANRDSGLYGTLTDPALITGEPIDVAARREVRLGQATILSNVSGDQVEEYQVEITKIYPASPGERRDLMIKVTDPRLLAQTGGIVQGMSGSPILQNGKLVGAVTHVLIGQPDTGYGILIETMLEAAA